MCFFDCCSYINFDYAPAIGRSARYARDVFAVFADVFALFGCTSTILDLLHGWPAEQQRVCCARARATMLQVLGFPLACSCLTYCISRILNWLLGWLADQQRACCARARAPLCSRCSAFLWLAAASHTASLQFLSDCLVGRQNNKEYAARARAPLCSRCLAFLWLAAASHTASLEFLIDCLVGGQNNKEHAARARAPLCSRCLAFLWLAGASPTASLQFLSDWLVGRQNNKEYAARARATMLQVLGFPLACRCLTYYTSTVFKLLLNWPTEAQRVCCARARSTCNGFL